MKANKFAILMVLVGIILMVAAACAGVDDNAVGEVEQAQQQDANLAIVQNQPIPDLGGYSFERQIVIDTYIARNNAIATYAYMITMDGRIIEICPSMGYPIPYSTQLTNPMKVLDRYEGDVTVPNAEPNSLYPPGDAAATLVQCVQPDGTVSPVYIEWYVLAFPFRIQSDYQLSQLTAASFTVKPGK